RKPRFEPTSERAHWATILSGSSWREFGQRQNRWRPGNVLIRIKCRRAVRRVTRASATTSALVEFATVPVTEHTCIAVLAVTQSWGMKTHSMGCESQVFLRRRFPNDWPERTAENVLY